MLQNNAPRDEWVLILQLTCARSVFSFNYFIFTDHGNIFYPNQCDKQKMQITLS